MISPNTNGFSGVITLISVTLIGVICNLTRELSFILNRNSLLVFRALCVIRSPLIAYHFPQEVAGIDRNPD
jgi:hypothetical protein